MLLLYLEIVRPYQRQVSSIDYIERSGGFVAAEPWGPDWLRSILGEKRMQGFDRVTQIQLYNNQSPELYRLRDFLETLESSF